MSDDQPKVAGGECDKTRVFTDLEGVGGLAFPVQLDALVNGNVQAAAIEVGSPVGGIPLPCGTTIVVDGAGGVICCRTPPQFTAEMACARASVDRLRERVEETASKQEEHRARHRDLDIAFHSARTSRKELRSQIVALRSRLARLEGGLGNLLRLVTRVSRAQLTGRGSTILSEVQCQELEELAAELYRAY